MQKNGMDYSMPFLRFITAFLFYLLTLALPLQTLQTISSSAGWA